MTHSGKQHAFTMYKHVLTVVRLDCPVLKLLKDLVKQLPYPIFLRLFHLKYAIGELGQDDFCRRKFQFAPLRRLIWQSGSAAISCSSSVVALPLTGFPQNGGSP